MLYKEKEQKTLIKFAQFK